MVLELDLFFPKNKRRIMPKDIDRRLNKLETSQTDAIDRLFEAYEELYNIALGDEDEESKRFVVKTTMKWVLCAFNQLTANMLVHAVSILPDGTKDKDLKVEDILDLCSNFIVRVSESRIRLAHLSVRQFFEEKHAVEYARPLQHLQVAMTCMHVVYSFFIESDADKSDTKQSSFQDFPRLRSKLVDDGKAANAFNIYSYLHWSIHCRLADHSTELCNLLDTVKACDIFLPQLNWLHLRVAKGADLLPQDLLGNTLLHNMVTQNELFHIDLLLRTDSLAGHSQLVRVKNRSGNSALAMAAMLGREEAFEKLVAAGSQVDSPNVYGLTAAHIAVVLGRYKMVQLVSRLGLDVIDPHENNLLHYAAFFNSTDPARALLAAGHSKNAKNMDGHDPLHVALASDSVRCMKVLIAAIKGVDVRLIDAYLEKYSSTDPEAFVRHLKDITFERQVVRDGILETQSTNRLEIRIDDTGVTSCSFCDIEGWLSGSRSGLSFDLYSSPEEQKKKVELIASGQLTCKLCVFLEDMIQSKLSSIDSSHLEKTKVRARLDEDSRGLEIGRDILIISLPGSEIELEFCIDIKGKSIFQIALNTT